MNKQLNKLRAANVKDRAKVDMLLARIRTRDEKITELENVDILGIVREYKLTPEMLAEILAKTPFKSQITKEVKPDEPDPT
jgi:outer membrane protein W